MQSVIRLRDYEMIRTQQLVAVRGRRARSGAIAKARNEITTMYQRGKADYLLFIDDDMGFPVTLIQHMLNIASPDRPIVGALCFAQRTEGFEEETNAEFFGHIPTLSVWDKTDTGDIVGFKTWADYPRNALIEVDSTGAACVMIHRSVIESMQERFGNNWWTQITHPTRPGDVFGEDTSFFLRAHDLGFPLHVHTGIRTSHDKGGIFLTEQTYDLQERMKAVLAAEAEGKLSFSGLLDFDDAADPDQMALDV